MILPIGHERAEVLRWPVISIALITINLTATMLVNPGVAAHRAQSVERLESVLDYLVEHPWIVVDERLPLPGWAREELAEVRTEMREAGVLNEVDTRLVQRDFDRMVDEWTELSEQAPLRRWGYVPSRPTLLTLFTTQFVHAGWLHLLSNLLILYLAGPPIEDRLGRPAFLAVYLGAGIAATLTHAAFAGLDAVPLVGASGAIAGLMAAFLLYFASTRLRFAWVLPPFFKTFTLPAFVILPLWLANEITAAVSSRAHPETAGGVANFAHLGGFAFGLAIIGSLRFTGIERLLVTRVDTRTGAEQRSDIERIYTMVERGRARAAWQAAQRAHARAPDDPELGLLLWRTARSAKQTASALGRTARLVRRQLAEGRREEALIVLSEMAEEHPDLPLGGPERWRLIEALEEAGEESWSEILRDGLEAEGGATGSTARVVAASVTPPASAPGAAVAEAPSRATVMLDREPPGIEWRHHFAEPIELLDEGVALRVGDQRRVLAYRRIVATSLARVDDRRVLPYHVVDLFLAPAADAGVSGLGDPLTTVRVLAPPWEGDLVAGGDLGEQCRRLVEQIAERAGCRQLAPQSREEPVPSYRSLGELERDIGATWARALRP